MDRFFSRHLHVGLVLAGSILVAGCNSDPVVWPVSGDAAGDWTLLTATYGPRIRLDEDNNEVYEFSRGIDIIVPERTDVHAIAAGTVQLIEQVTAEGGMRVQIAHDGYVSNYMHLLKVDAQVGDLVDPGDYIATSGTSLAGDALLHFEIRKPGFTKSDCIHPFRVLPYFDRGAPSLEISEIDTTNPLLPKVTAKVIVRNRELDLLRISATTFEGPREALLDGLSPLSEQSWDMEEWNREKTATADSDPTAIHSQTPNGIEVRPDLFNNVSTEQTFSFTFTQLVGAKDATNLRIRIQAEDISGNVVIVTGP